MDLVLHTDASYRNDLDTGKFARMLDDPSQCYKFYWLEAILNLMPTEEGDISFEKIIDEMICDVWYSVTRYKLHLGPTKSEVAECDLSEGMTHGSGGCVLVCDVIMRAKTVTTEIVMVLMKIPLFEREQGDF